LKLKADEVLARDSPIIRAAYELVWEFRRMIKTRDGKKLKDWLGKAEQSRISELASALDSLSGKSMSVEMRGEMGVKVFFIAFTIPFRARLVAPRP
jgi:transposase